MSEGISLEGFRPRLTDAQIEKSSQMGSRLTNGAWYKFQVTAGAKITIHETSGNMQLRLPVVPLDADDQPRKPSLSYFITLPWVTPEEKLLEQGLAADLQSSGKGAPNTAFLIAIYLRAVYGDSQFPSNPRYNKEADAILFQGEEMDREEAQVKSAELTAKRDDFFGDSVENPDSFTGDRFFAQVKDNENNDFQSIVVDFSESVPQYVLPEGAVVGEF